MPRRLMPQTQTLGFLDVSVGGGVAANAMRAKPTTTDLW